MEGIIWKYSCDWWSVSLPIAEQLVSLKANISWFSGFFLFQQQIQIWMFINDYYILE
jgi:hypothetical protein